MLEHARIFADREAGGFTDMQCLSALTRMNWITQRWPEQGKAQIHAALSANPRRVLPFIIQVAIESGDPIGIEAAEWFDSNPEIELAAKVHPDVPTQTVALREFAAVIERILLDAARDDTARAGSLNNLANRLSALGRREEALAAAEEAVRLYRTLAQARPDAFMPDLAGSLNNLAARLSDLGRREEALAAVEEAVRLYRTLAQARPDAFMPDLAGSLNNLANMLSDLGRREEALAAAEEAVRLYRTLAQARPDAFMPDLAMSLNNLANMLSDLGRPEEALAAAEETIAKLRSYFTDRPRAFADRMVIVINTYLRMCEFLKADPDPGILTPIIEVLISLRVGSGS